MRSVVLIALVGCGRIGFDPISTPSDTAIRLVVGVEGMNDSYLYILEYTPGAPASSAISRLGPVLLRDVGATRGRGLAPLSTNEVLVGSGQTSLVEIIQLDTMSAAGTIVLPGLDDVHGLCTLPSGGIVAGEFGHDPNRVREYMVAAPGATLVGDVTTATQVLSGTMTMCIAPTDDELYITEEDANADLDGDVVRLTRNPASRMWAETHRLDGSVLLASKYGANHETGFWAIAISGEALYAFPIRRGATQIPTLIRCGLPNIGADNCEELAILPPDTSPIPNGPPTLQGAIAVPGTDELLFATNQKLFRYDIGQDAWVELLDMWSAFDDLVDTTGAPDQMHAVRNLVIR